MAVAVPVVPVATGAIVRGSEEGTTCASIVGASGGASSS